MNVPASENFTRLEKEIWGTILTFWQHSGGHSNLNMCFSKCHCHIAVAERSETLYLLFTFLYLSNFEEFVHTKGIVIVFTFIIYI